jgi:hypothetical protein
MLVLQSVVYPLDRDFQSALHPVDLEQFEQGLVRNRRSLNESRNGR